MNSIATLWSGLSAGRRAIVVLATLAVFVSLMLMARGVGNRDLALLYASLEDNVAGDVIAALEQQGVVYEVRGSAIFVPVEHRDQLRLTLAGSGLPANTSQGYELLDTLTGFGTTSQMFDAAYWRAKEGELARTILASPHIQTARVHISSQVSRPFQRANLPTAAVTVGTSGGTLSAAQANALRYLVSSSISGLTPENVAVIDGQGGLISGEDDALGASGQNRVEALRFAAQRILEARVGPGNAIVEVSIEAATETESIIERRIDPDSRIAISTEVEERTSTSQDSRVGDVTVASNLPAGDGAATDGGSASDDTETRSVTNYEVSETSREVLRAPGAISRLTIAVLVNEATVVGEDGEVIPRNDDELASLGELVASAVGLDEERGDILTIRSMAFEPIPLQGTDAIVELGQPLDMMMLIQLGVLAAVALILGLFVVRPLLSPAPRALAELPSPVLEMSGDIVDASATNTGAMLAPRRSAEDSPALDVAVSNDGGSQDPVTRLRQLIDEREDETIHILQNWIENPAVKEGVN